MQTRRTRGIAAIAAMLLLGACSSESATETSTTVSLPQSSEQTSTTIQPGRVEDLVKILWQVDANGNAVSVLPESGDLALAWQTVANDGGVFEGSVVRDQAAESTDAFGQSAIANGGGAWERVYKFSRKVDQTSLEDGYIMLSVAVIRQSGDASAVRRAGDASVPPGSAAIEVGGAPVGTYSVAWSTTDGRENAYVASVNNSIIVRCEISSPRRSTVSVCGAANAYIFERLGDSYIG